MTIKMRRISVHKTTYEKLDEMKKERDETFNDLLLALIDTYYGLK